MHQDTTTTDELTEENLLDELQHRAAYCSDTSHSAEKTAPGFYDIQHAESGKLQS